MLATGWARTVLRKLVFGPPIPQFSTVALTNPQSEVRGWLRGLGAPLEVTDCNVIASARPFTIGIGLQHLPDEATVNHAPLFLSFRDRAGDARLLGEIQLSYSETIGIGDRVLCLFRALRST